MLTRKELEAKREQIAASRGVYEQQIAKCEGELKRHDGALWMIDQLMGALDEQAAPEKQETPT